MKPSYSQTQIDEICGAFFKEVGDNHFQIKMTVGGSPCIIISRNSGGFKPIMGVYYSGEEWVPAKWTEKGRYIDDDHPRLLDLDVIETEQEYA